MEIFEGKLRFLGWRNRPWLLSADDGRQIDLWPYFVKALTNLNGKSAKMEQGRDNSLSGISFKQDDTSEYLVEFEVDVTALMAKKEGFGFSNIIAYVEHVLQAINGRRVIVEATDNSFSIKADPAEEVFGLYYTSGNGCSIPDDKETEICRFDKGADSCVFASVTGDGFECQKFNPPIARIILDRLARGTFNAKCIGNCAILGRKE